MTDGICDEEIKNVESMNSKWKNKIREFNQILENPQEYFSGNVEPYKNPPKTYETGNNIFPNIKIVEKNPAPNNNNENRPASKNNDNQIPDLEGIDVNLIIPNKNFYEVGFHPYQEDKIRKKINDFYKKCTDRINENDKVQMDNALNQLQK